MGVLLLKVHYHFNSFIKKILYKILYKRNVKFGKKMTFRRNFSLYIDKGKVFFGDNVFFNHNCSIASLKKITIGNDCIFGENVKIYDHNHIFKNKTKIKNQGFSSGEISIGDNCWIGSNVIILKNVSIGDNCVIGAGCIVNTNIPSNSIVRSNRDIFVEELLYE